MFFRMAAFVASAALIGTAQVAPVFANSDDGHSGANQLKRINHIVVIYQENHSFDNLFGSWGGGVNGLPAATPAHKLQVNQAGIPFNCLLQNDVNLTSPPLAATCTDTTTATPFSSAFTNKPFAIDAIIPTSATTCPAPGVFAANGVANGSGQPGGCTRDIVHRFYQEPYQLNSGQMNRYTTGSDAVGLTQGYYDTTKLPIYSYLHQEDHPAYAIADDFFQAAFGGSFLNHQWLVAAATPVWPAALNDGSANDLHSVVDVNGMPNNYPLYASPAGTTVKDQALTASCTPGPGRGPTPPGVVCGDYAVNTIQPTYQPYAPGHRPQPAAAAADGAHHRRPAERRQGRLGLVLRWLVERRRRHRRPRLDERTRPTCADPPRPRERRVSRTAPTSCSSSTTSPSTTSRRMPPARRRAPRTCATRSSSSHWPPPRTRSCNLKPVSFVKPIGAENEHPGYASENAGSNHLVVAPQVDREQPLRARTRWSSSPTTSSAASGTT